MVRNNLGKTFISILIFLTRKTVVHFAQICLKFDKEIDVKLRKIRNILNLTFEHFTIISDKDLLLREVNIV